ncbi:MAG: helix-turn-helix domain-containing protein [Planctomycetota bacterium]
MNELAEKIGERIKQLRKQAGLTQSQLAEAATTDDREITRVFVGALERGEKTPSLKTLDQLARALDVTLSQLLDVDHQVSGSEDDAQRLGRLLTTLASGASEADLARFEKLLRAYFDAGKPRESKKRGRRKE